MSSRARRLITLVGLTAILMAIGIPWLGLQVAAREREQRAAERGANQQLWERQGMRNYAITIDENSCQYVAEVRGEISVVDLSRSSCSFQPSAIDGLFRLLERDGMVERLCDTRGCPCESVVSVRGSYHPERGYPTRVVVDVDLRPAWLSADLWRHLAENQALPPCVTHNTSIISVVAIEPR